MDGNRRYSEKVQIAKEDGYKAGLEQFIKFVKYQIKYEIKETSYFALSSDNLEKRESTELLILKKLLETFTKNSEIKELFLENKIQIKMKGNYDENIPRIKEFGISKLKKEFENWNNQNENHKFIVNIAINYDGQKEIAHAFKKIYNKIQNKELSINDINEKTIKENIWFNGQIPQIIVRPGDAPRLSGFMLWDSEYSEIYLTKKLWPELDENDYLNIIDFFKTQKRNFGK